MVSSSDLGTGSVFMCQEVKGPLSLAWTVPEVDGAIRVISEETILFFPLTTTIVKSNIQNKSSATNARPPGPQATPTSVGESPDSLNLIFHARRTVRCSSRSVSAAKVSRNASPELSFFSKEEESEEKEVSPGPRTLTVSRIITGKLSHRIAPLQLSATPQAPLSTSLISHSPNHGTAESFSQVEGGSAVAGTCDVTGDCDTLVIHNSDSSVTHDHDNLPQAS